MLSDKAALRTQFKAARKAIPAPVRDMAEQHILRHSLMALDAVTPQPQCVALYIPQPGEVDITPLRTALLAAGTQVALPVTTAKGEGLVFRLWQSEVLTQRDVWGIPVPDGAICQPDVAFVPLVAFTRTGARLGMGAGHYDRTLAAHPHMLAIGVAFACQEAQALPTQPHDKPLAAVMTEREMIACQI